MGVELKSSSGAIETAGSTDSPDPQTSEALEQLRLFAAQASRQTEENPLVERRTPWGTIVAPKAYFDLLERGSAPVSENPSTLIQRLRKQMPRMF